MKMKYLIRGLSLYGKQPAANRNHNEQNRTEKNPLIRGLSTRFASSLLLALALASPAFAGSDNHDDNHDTKPPLEGYMVGDVFKDDTVAYDAYKKDKPTKITEVIKNGKVNVLAFCFFGCMPCDMLTKVISGGVGSLNTYDKTQYQLLRQAGLTAKEIEAENQIHDLPADFWQSIIASDLIRGAIAGKTGVELFPGDFTPSTFYGNKINMVDLIFAQGDFSQGLVSFFPSNRFEALGYKSLNLDAPPDGLLHSNTICKEGATSLNDCTAQPIENLSAKMLTGLRGGASTFLLSPATQPGFPTAIVIDKVSKRIVGIVSGGGLTPGAVSGNLDDNRTGYIHELLADLINENRPQRTDQQIIADINANIFFVTRNIGDPLNLGGLGATEVAAMVDKLNNAKNQVVLGERKNAAANLQDFWKLLRARFGAPSIPGDANSPLISSKGEGPSRTYVSNLRDIESLEKKRSGDPVLLATSTNVAGTGTSGSLTFPVAFGYTGNYVAEMHGLAAPVTQTGQVADDPNDIFPLPPTLSAALALGNVVSAHAIAVPAGTVIARFRTTDATTTGNADLDMYLYDPSGKQIANSLFIGPSGEQIELRNPAPGTYTVVMYGYSTDGPPADYTLFTWIPSANVGNATVTAPSATQGTLGDILVNWTGLAPATDYLGYINHVKDGVTLETTIIDVVAP
jgi:hypothetical protein